VNHHAGLKSVISILFCRRSELCGDLPWLWSYSTIAGELLHKLQMLNMNGLWVIIYCLYVPCYNIYIYIYMCVYVSEITILLGCILTLWDLGVSSLWFGSSQWTATSSSEIVPWALATVYPKVETEVKTLSAFCYVHCSLDLGIVK
jgi:hypothetical protein